MKKLYNAEIWSDCIYYLQIEIKYETETKNAIISLKIGNVKSFMKTEGEYMKITTPCPPLLRGNKERGCLQ